MDNFFKHYRYDFSTEGKDPVSKMIASTKIGLIGGGFMAIYDTILRRPAYSTADALGRSSKYLFYWTALSTTYAATVYICTNLRKKDDSLNYALAGVTTAGVLYSITKNGPLAYTLGTWGVIFGWIFKKSISYGLNPFDQSDIKLNYYHDYTHDLHFNDTPDLRYSN